MQKWYSLLLTGLLALASYAQQAPLWLRYHSILPEGKTIAFGYRATIYSVEAGSSTAV